MWEYIKTSNLFPSIVASPPSNPAARYGIHNTRSPAHCKAANPAVYHFNIPAHTCPPHASGEHLRPTGMPCATLCIARYGNSRPFDFPSGRFKGIPPLEFRTSRTSRAQSKAALSLANLYKTPPSRSILPFHRPKTLAAEPKTFPRLKLPQKNPSLNRFPAPGIWTGFSLTNSADSHLVRMKFPHANPGRQGILFPSGSA